MFFPVEFVLFDTPQTNFSGFKKWKRGGGKGSLFIFILPLQFLISHLSHFPSRSAKISRWKTSGGTLPPTPPHPTCYATWMKEVIRFLSLGLVATMKELSAETMYPVSIIINSWCYTKFVLKYLCSWQHTIRPNTFRPITFRPMSFCPKIICPTIFSPHDFCPYTILSCMIYVQKYFVRNVLGHKYLVQNRFSPKTFCLNTFSPCPLLSTRF